MKIHIINNFVVDKGSAFDSMVTEGAGDHHIMVQRLDLMALLLDFLSTSSLKRRTGRFTEVVVKL
jgi:hypothetical protein